VPTNFNRPVAETRKPRWRETGKNRRTTGDHRQQIRNAGDSNSFPLMEVDHARQRLLGCTWPRQLGAPRREVAASPGRPFYQAGKKTQSSCHHLLWGRDVKSIVRYAERGITDVVPSSG
jgi:hypothetical protein